MIDLNRIFDELFPLCRSITGAGFRQSIDIFARHMDLTIHRYETGKKVFDWVVPKEWEIDQAYLEEVDGKRICDFKDHNLHVVNYSVAVDNVLALSELQNNLYSLSEQPELIPYVTSYYREHWGFCIPHSQREKLRNTSYRAVIRSRLIDGFVEVADADIKGTSDKTILLTSYLCHPSMANNELSGPLVLLGLYQRLQTTPGLFFNYKFLLHPETIGSICYLHSHGKMLKENVAAGLVLTCLGGPESKLSYKFSKRGQSSFDKLMRHLGDRDVLRTREFTPSGSDERQFCSPGIDLPMGQMSRTVYGEYPEYHTSGDTKEFMGIDKIESAIDEIHDLLMLNERIRSVHRREPCCEIQLGKRGLYPNVNFQGAKGRSGDDLNDSRERLNAIVWLLNLADGATDIVDMANRSKMGLRHIEQALDILEREDLVYLK